MLQLVHLCAATLSRLKGGGGPDSSSSVAPHTLAMLDILTRHRSHQAKELSETLGVVAGKLPIPPELLLTDETLCRAVRSRRRLGDCSHPEFLTRRDLA